jgi:thioesterase domain-containing protein/acyl carrier protein
VAKIPDATAADGGSGVREATLSIGAITAIWERVLGHSPIDPDENFFDLGGDSLRAVELMAEIETLSGRELPVTLLFEAPSVSALSAALHDAEPRRFSPLVRLSDDTGGTPLILIPGIAGNIMEVVSLAKKLKPWAIPLYGLQPRGLDPGEVPFDSIEQLAQYYLDEIKARINGPFSLLGYSFGGLVAFEIARRCLSEGRRVPAVILLDCYLARQSWPWQSKLELLYRRFLKRLSGIMSGPPREAGPKLLQLCRDLVDLARRGRSDEVASWPAVPLDMPPAMRRVVSAHRVAFGRYRPSYFDGRVTFVRATESDLIFCRAWQSAARQFELRTVAGSHTTMMDAHTDELATLVSGCLETERTRPDAEEHP